MRAPQLIVQTGPTGARALAFSPDGRWLASGGDDHLVRVWELATRRVVQRLSAHTAPVQTIAFSRDGTLLASGSDDHTSIVWNVASATAVRRFVAPKGPIDDVEFSPDGRLLIARSGWHAALWEIPSGAFVEAFTGETYGHALSFSPDGESLTFLDRDRRSIAFWSVTTRRVMRRVPIEVSRSLVEWTPVVVRRLLDLNALGGAVTETDVKALIGDAQLAAPGRDAPVALSTDGRLLAASREDRDRLTGVWDVAARRFTCTVTGRAVALAFSHDGRWLAFVDRWVGNRIRLHDLASGAMVAELGRDVDRSRSVHFSDRGTSGGLSVIVETDAGTPQSWDAASGRSRPINGIPPIPSGPGGAPLLISSPSVIWTSSPDGSVLAHTVPGDGAEPNGVDIRVLEIATGRERQTFSSGIPAVRRLTLSADNRWLLAAGDRSAALWDLTGVVQERRFTGSEVYLSPDGQWLASHPGGYEKRVTLIQLFSGATRVLPSNGSVVFSASGRYVAAGHDIPVGVWEVETGLRRVYARGSGLPTGRKSFCPDERCILIASTTKHLQLWDIAAGRELIPDLSRLAGPSSRHSFSADMRWLAITATDGSVEIWDMSRRSLAASIYLTKNGQSWLVTTPSGFFDSPEDADTELIAWNDGNELSAADRYWHQRRRPQLLAEVLSGVEWSGTPPTERRR